MATKYRKIPGVGTGSPLLGGRPRLYTADDHLLLVSPHGFKEEYKRIFFRDIRYVEVRKTRGYITQAIIATSIAALLAAFLLAIDAPLVAVLIVCAPFLIWLGINLALGPTCMCFINTNVQAVMLPRPGRRRKVRPLVAFIRERTGSRTPPG